jgi:TPR repeat protein
MYEVTSDQELDQLIWSFIEDSCNPHDYLDYIRHTHSRPAEQEFAYELADSYWSEQNAPRQFGLAVTALQELAAQGSEIAMFHLGRWYRLGYGVPIDTVRSLDWYRKGAEAGSSRCLITLARHTAKDNPHLAIEMFRKAAEEMGDLSAHSFWADEDKARYDHHLELGATSGDPYAMYCQAYHRLKLSQTDEEAKPWIELLTRAAEKHESYSCMHLGLIYRNGFHGWIQDKEAAHYWLKRSAALGYEMACAALGRYLLVEDEACGRMYLKRSAMLGEAYGQSVLGHHLTWHGKSPEEQLEGVAWMREAAKQGHRAAFAKLAEALVNERGPEAQDNEALHWLHKGASMGIADCQTSLGTAYIRGDLVEADHEKGHNLFHLASLQGDVWGTYLLGMTYENGDGTAKDPVQAFHCYKTVAEKGLTKGIFKLGMAYIWGEGVAQDIPAGAKWLKKAASEDNADAQAYLGMMFVYGHGVEENLNIALHWLRQAANQDSPIGLRELAYLYESGTGVEADLSEATRLMGRAASLGDSKAQDWIAKNCPEKPAWLKDIGEWAGKELPNDGHAQGE